jgi:hypothetical protein
VADSVAIYSISRAWATVLFLLVLLLELTASFLFWRAALETSPGSLAPFLVGISLFCAFLVADEVLLVYRRFPNLETSHFTVFSGLLLSLLLVRGPDRGRS